MLTLSELRDREAPMPWQRALGICRAIAQQRVVGTPALASGVILISGDEVHVTTLAAREVHDDSGDEHNWVRDGAMQLWKNMKDRAAMFVPRDHLIAYWSPEQLMGKSVDETSYVYSIGVIAYDLLTGCVPFADARGPAGIITAQLKREPAPPSSLVPVPAAVDTLVLRCLRKQRTERFDSLDALVNAIAELC